MKKILILCCAALICSCNKLEILTPLSEEDRALTFYLEEKGTTPAGLLREIGKGGQSVLLIGSRGIESDLELMKYFVPVLVDMDRFSLGLWFLNQVPSKSIERFFSQENSNETAEDLLFQSNPALTGFTEYAEFLEYLKKTVQSLSDEVDWLITGSTEAEDSVFLNYITFDSYTRNSRDFTDYYTLFIHNPVQPAEEKSYFPFQGRLYYLLIHKWPQYQYGGIDLKGSPFGELFFNPQDMAEGVAVKNRFDGIVLAGIDKGFIPLHPIENFINENNALRALDAFPDQVIRKKVKPASYLMNMKLRMEERKRRKNLEKMAEFLSDYYPSND